MALISKFQELHRKRDESMGHVRSDRYIIPRLSLQRPQKPHGFSLGRGVSVLQKKRSFCEMIEAKQS